MVQRIEFDGVIHEFPDDFTQADISQALDTLSPLPDEAISAQPPAAPPPPIPEVARPAELAPAPTLGQRLDRAFGVVGGAANRGLATMAGALVEGFNAAPMLLNLLPGEQGVGPISREPVGGVATFQNLLAGSPFAGVPREELRGAGERIPARVMEEVGANVPITGALGAIAQRAPAAARGAQVAAQPGVAGRVAETFLEPFRRSPGRAIATEQALATGAGLGSGLAQEAGAERGGALDLTATFLGSLGAGGAMEATRQVSGLGRLAAEGAAKAAGLGSAESPTVRRSVGEFLAEQTADPRQAPARIEEGLAIAREGVPGVRPTTAEAAADPGLQALEFQRQSGPRAGAFRQRRAENIAAQEAELAKAAPEGQPEAAREAIQRAEEQRIAQERGAVQREVEGAEEAQEEALRRTRPSQTRAEAGETIRREAEGRLERLKLTRQEKSDPDLQEALASDASVDAGPVDRLIDAELRQTKRDPVISALKTVKEKLRRDPTPAEIEAAEAAGREARRPLDDTVEGLYETRKVINDLIEGRSENATGRFAQKELVKVKKALDEQINKVEPAFGRYLKSFREESRPIDILQEGRTGRIAKRDKLTGTPEIEASAVPSQFIRKGDGSKEAVDEFVQQFRSRPAASRALREAALNDAREAFEKGGEKGLRRWIADHEEILGQFRNTRSELLNLADARAAVERARRLEKMTEKGIEKPREQAIATYLDADSGAAAMGRILQNKQTKERQIRQLLNLVRGDKDATEGIKRAFWDHTFGDSPGALGATRSLEESIEGVSFLQPGKLKRFMRANDGVLKLIYRDDPQQLTRINKIAEAVQRGAQVARARPPGTSGTPLGQRDIPVFNLSSALSRAFNVQKGVVSPQFVIIESGLRAGRTLIRRVKRNEFEALLDRALLEPEVAKTLLMEFNKGTERVLQQRLRTHLGHDVTVAISEDGDTARDEEKPGVVALAPASSRAGVTRTSATRASAAPAGATQGSSISPKLVDAIIKRESNGNPKAVSPKGAQGLAQVMPATAKKPGFGVKPLRNPFDPVESRRFLRDYYSALLDNFDGDHRAALAAYNWGPANVENWLARGGRMEDLPAETRSYVRNLLPVARNTRGPAG